MKEDKDDVVLLSADIKDKIVTEKDESEDMVVDVVGADSARVDSGFNGVVDENSAKGTDTRDRVMEDVGMVESEGVTLDKSGNEPVVEGSRKPKSEETGAVGEETIGVRDKKVAEPNIESVEEVAADGDEKDGKEVEVLSSSKISEGQVEVADEGLVGNDKAEDAVDKQSSLIEVGMGEGNVHERTKNDEQGAGGDHTRNESLQSTMEGTPNVLQKSERGLTEETVERATESLKEVTDEVLDSTKVLESVTKVDEVVAVESLAEKDETQDGNSEDQSSLRADNPNLSSDVINSETAEILDQKAEIVKEENLQSTIEAKTDNASKMDAESRSKEPQIIEEEIAVVDNEKEPEIGLTKETVQQPTGSVQEVAEADHLMDETTEREEDALDSLKIQESSTVTNLGSEEVDVVVVEEGSEGKDEVQEVVNAGTEEVLTTERSETGVAEPDEVITVDKELSSFVQVSTAGGILVENQNLKASDVADSSEQNSQEDQGLNAIPSNDQSLHNSGNETTEPQIEVPDSSVEVQTMGVPQTAVEDFDKANHQTTHTGYAEHGVLSADTHFSYDEAHMDRGDDAGMDIDEVLGWNNELDEQKVDPSNLPLMDENIDVEEQETDGLEHTLEAKQWHETAVSLHQSCYFHPPENEGEFSVSDLVWGKVRSHPWWPGQIFDPSDASEKAMKYHKKDCFLVAYFGDRTFAWNESTVLKPFRSNFSQIANHTNSEAFNNAVHCALEEVSRRVELGLACSCIPHDFYDNIKCQIVENAGIKQESSKRHGIDKSASVNSFEPNKLVDYVRLLAKFPYGEGDKMELTMAKAQLSSYGRYKGYRQLAEFQLCGDLLEADQVMNDAMYIEDGSKKRKALDSISDGLEKRPSLHIEPVPTAKSSFKVGACIQRVASQLTGPPSKGELADQVVGIAASDQAELLSQLHLAARDPMKGYNFLNTIIPFFNSHRAAVLNKARQNSIDARKRKISNENDPEEFEFDDVNDSYWTDRIIQNYPDEQLLQENQNGDGEHQIVAYEQDKQPVKPTRRSNKKRFFSSNHEIEAKEQTELIERRRLNLATEVLMKFTEGIYFPSEIHLNKMFKRFGPLMESETEVDRQGGRARVVFKKCSDAEVAHSSAGKFNIFGSIVVNYELNYTPLISYKPFPLPLAQDLTDAC